MIQRKLIRVKVLTTVLLLVTAAGVPSWADSIRINGFEMHYELVGEGEPLLMLHGGFGVGAEFVDRYGGLTSDFQLILPDLRGHGRSVDLLSDLSPRSAASDVFALLDHLELDRVLAYGGSYGAAILLHMAIQQPDRLEAMVLGAAGDRISEDGRGIMCSFDIAGMPAPFVDRLRRVHVQGDEQINALAARFCDAANDYDEFDFAADELATVTARALIVNGDRDEYFAPEAALRLHRSIPSSYLWLIPNGEHAVLIFDARTHEFSVDVFLDFLKGEWEPASVGGPTR